MKDDLARIAARCADLPEPTWLWDAERRRILWANAAALEFWGVDSLFDLIEYTFAPGSPEARAAAEPGEDVAAMLAPPGSVAHVRLDVADAGHAGARELRLVTIKSVRAAGPPESERGRALFEATPVALCLTGVDGAVIETNEALRDLVGAAPAQLGELIGQAEAETLLSQALVRGQANLTVQRLPAILRVAATRLADPATATAALLVRIDDVTERRALEALLAEQNRAAAFGAEPQRAPASDLAEAASEGLLALDAHGRIVHANGAAASLLGLAPEALRHRPLTDFLPEALHGDVAEFLSGQPGPVARALAQGREIDLRSITGAAKRARLRLKSLDHEGFAAAINDLSQAFATETAAERARDEAERKSQAKSDFIAKLSHEMRNPLNAIIGFSEIMQNRHFGPLGDRRYESYADDIRSSADYLLSLVNDLLDLARIESGRLQLEFDSVVLPNLIEECARLLKPQAASYGVTLRLSVPANLPPVVADARSIRQVLINLVSNALKFTARGGEVTVSAKPDDDGGVSIKVADTGVGMSRGEIQLALEPFGQVDGPLQRERKGTGLGLPLAKALTEANKALFRIQSEPQHGTQVHILFPSTRVLAG